MPALPIDPLLDRIVDALGDAQSLVIEAPPGAGKTTRVPAALIDAPVRATSEIWVLQPRRLAARLAARFVAQARGESVGETVGYQVRFEDVSGPKTRLRFLTEGLLLRRLLSNPRLDGVKAVVFDEFHERHLAADTGLAWCRHLQGGERPDLKLVVMSATLAGEPLAAYLGDCPRLRCEGKRYDVAIEHAAHQDDRPLEIRVRAALGALCQSSLGGDVLVFLPGVREIRRAQEACRALAEHFDLSLLPLHGSLSVLDQDRALAPAKRRKVILATNVAETSITIDGVTAVIDSGLVRSAAHDPGTGISTLRVKNICRASAEQRAGRAGRTGPGRCVRLYTSRELRVWDEFETPEIRRLDLAPMVLAVRAGGMDVADLSWLDPPPASSLEVAEQLLAALGAVAPDGSLSEMGRGLLRFPVHPRHGRILNEAAIRGVGDAACSIVALLGERDLRATAASPAGTEGRDHRESGPSDLLDLVETLEEAERARFVPARLRSLGIHPGPARAAARTRDQLRRLVGGAVARAETAPPSEEELLIAVLAGYPDRVARAREGQGERRGQRELQLCTGARVRLADSSVVRDSPWVVVVEAEARRRAGATSTLAWLASRVEPEWLLDLFGERIRESTELRWSAAKERVDEIYGLTYGQLVLDEDRRAAPPSAGATRLLTAALGAAGPAALVDPDRLEVFFCRLALAREQAPDLGLPDLEAGLPCLLDELCEGAVSFAELRELDILSIIYSRLGATRASFDSLLPEQVSLPGGRRLRVHYERDRPPWVESRLQDFFGSQAGPSILGGRVGLTLHLLAPNQRAVQVTTDLAGFWETHYPSLRRGLSRRYPRHAWPKDPAGAQPPRPGRTR